MAVDLHINWSANLTYFFQNGSQRFANLSPTVRNVLGTLRVTEDSDSDGYGLDSLQVLGMYQFKRFEVEGVEGSLRNFPAYFGTNFEEVSFFEVTFNDDASQNLAKNILRSPNLKSLKIKNSTFTDEGMFPAITEFIHNFQFEKLTIAEVMLGEYKGDFTQELGYRGFGEIVKRWRVHPSPKMRSLTIGTMWDDSFLDVEDIFTKKLRAHVFFNYQARQWLEVEVCEPVFRLYANPANSLRDIPREQWKEMPKEDLIGEICRLQN